ncbi:MAG TPA: hypothetical protein VFQ39_14110 [Longimicrobium sp.]|nr:hypothetical protein [Longimicrobium sp.]
MTFDVARSLVTGPELRTALDEMNGVRTLRHDVEYEPEHEVDEGIVATTLDVAGRILRLGAAHLNASRPSLGARLRSPQPRGGG